MFLDVIGSASAVVELVARLQVVSSCRFGTNPRNGLLPGPHNYTPW